jgi:SH3-like domain-containing protein
MLGLILPFLFLSHLTWAEPVPAYLKPNNPAATGHFDKDQLRSSAITYDQFEWLWVSNAQGQNGWILKSLALLPLDFSRQAVIQKGETIFAHPRHYSEAQTVLANSQVVNLVGRSRSWYKVVYKDKEKKNTGWVRAQNLSPHSKDAGLFFSTQETQLRQQPQMKSKILAQIEPGTPIIPLNAKGEWALVQYKNQKGYIPFRNIKTRMDVAIKVRTDEGYFVPNRALYQRKIHEIFANPIWAGTGPFSLDLKSQPDMSSDTVAVIAPWQELTIQGYSVKRWGKSRIATWGELWWPDKTIESNVELTERFPPQLVSLKKSEIYQIEKSPVSKNLYFASATNGIYRSFDLKNWHPIKPFKNGFPIKLADNGVLFVADKVSFDHGETFQDFIRWDIVFDSVPNKEQITQGPIQILNVEPHQGGHKKITLSVKVGQDKYMQFYTADMGRHWRIQSL